MSRGDEHHKAAAARRTLSHLYFTYTSASSSCAVKRVKRGLYEHLEFVIAAGFDPSSDPAKKLDKDMKEGGLFILSDEDKHNIKASMGEKGKKFTHLQKCHDISAYQLEFGYDLVISPDMHVSCSPGLEAFLGVFGGTD